MIDKQGSRVCKHIFWWWWAVKGACWKASHIGQVFRTACVLRRTDLRAKVCKLGGFYQISVVLFMWPTLKAVPACGSVSLTFVHRNSVYDRYLTLDKVSAYILHSLFIHPHQWFTMVWVLLKIRVLMDYCWFACVFAFIQLLLYL